MKSKRPTPQTFGEVISANLAMPGLFGDSLEFSAADQNRFRKFATWLVALVGVVIIASSLSRTLLTVSSVEAGEMTLPTVTAQEASLQVTEPASSFQNTENLVVFQQTDGIAAVQPTELGSSLQGSMGTAPVQ
jgi:hypothetical protein